ncbi:MAG TPA: ABC transporter ATP-binding protein [Firmicutes bacterium]|nr:ABC transporter ATP-binding protein [Bacillota bacterium]
MSQDVPDKGMLRIECKKSYPRASGSAPEFTLQARFGVQREEFFSLVGPSGCGKTTLLRLIAGLERPDQGRIILNNVEITDLPPARRKIGFVFQDYALFPHLTVEENIAYGLKILKLPSTEIRLKVAELLEIFALQGLATREVDQLSGGERQRVALARALAPQPLILLLDEPFAALDYELRHRLRRELKELQKNLGFTAIFVTHQQEEALSLSDRLAVMRNGRIIQIGTAQEVYDHPQTSFVAEFLGEANLIPCLAQSTPDNGCLRLELPNRRRLCLNLNEDAVRGKSLPGRYYLLIRPEDLVINPQTTVFEGTIDRLEYYGHYTRVEIKTAGLLLHAMVGKGVPGLIQGRTVRVGFHLDRARLLPREADHR